MGERYNSRWLATVNAGAGVTSDPVLIPDQYEDLTVGAVPTAGGSVLVQFALANPDLVVADPASVTWYSWDDGAVGTATARVLTGSVTAVRITATTQAGKAELVARFDR